MPYGFHKHTRLYVDAIQQAGFTSFSAANEKLVDELIRELDSIYISGQSIWERTNYMFLAATDGGADIAKINLRQPYRTPGTGTPNFTSKKGISGTVNTGFDLTTHSRIGVPNAVDTSFWVYVVEGGISTVPGIENFTACISVGGIYQIVRARVTPHMDCIINTTVANPVSFTGTIPPQDNTLYHVEFGNPGGGVTRSLARNKTMQRVLNGGGGGTIPPSPVSVSYGSSVDISRMIGGIGGGRSVDAPGKYDITGGFQETLKKYFDAVQLL